MPDGLKAVTLAGEQITKIYPSKEGLKYNSRLGCLTQPLLGARWDGSSFPCRRRPCRRRGDPSNIWEVKVDAVTGRPLGEARRLSQWLGLSNCVC